MSEQEIHARLSAECFNGVWELLDKSDRTEADDRLMREMAHASLFHWLRREDVAATKVSVGLWQVSRVHAVLGDGAQAMRYAEECIRLSEGEELPPFYQGYAREAAARAARRLGAEERCRAELEAARSLAGEVEEEDERAMLIADIEELERGPVV